MANSLDGRQPAPLTGKREINYGDPASSARATAVGRALQTLWIDHQPQQAIAARICQLLDETRGVRGEPLPGLRLSQESQAGKSGALNFTQRLLADRRKAAGLPANEYQLIIIGLDKKTSLKGVYQDILIKMKDDEWDKGTEKVLRQRVHEFVRKLDVEAIAVDEIQHLKREKGEVTDVTDALKRLLDLGIVPLICVGDQDSLEFFERNKALAARLGEPLELTPLRKSQRIDAINFKAFCSNYALAMLSKGITTTLADLTTASILEGLLAASGGHIGRVARILQHAARHAAWRGAATVEPYDLSHSVRSYAIPKWIAFDPFSLPSENRAR
jgi:hypothetical protein